MDMSLSFSPSGLFEKSRFKHPPKKLQHVVFFGGLCPWLQPGIPTMAAYAHTAAAHIAGLLPDDTSHRSALMWSHHPELRKENHLNQTFKFGVPCGLQKGGENLKSWVQLPGCRLPLHINWGFVRISAWWWRLHSSRCVILREGIHPKKYMTRIKARDFGNDDLCGGFRYSLFSILLGEMIQFDHMMGKMTYLTLIFFRWVAPCHSPTVLTPSRPGRGGRPDVQKGSGKGGVSDFC